MNHSVFKRLMTVTSSPAPSFASQLVNGVLSIKPLFNVAKHQARQMMIKRAGTIGINWMQEVAYLRSRGGTEAFAPQWETELTTLKNSQLDYPDYYLRPFHAYDQGNLSWEAATEVEVAAHAVHARIWPEAGAQGDARLRQSYHQIIQAQLPQAPQGILDLGCSVGMSTFSLQAIYPEATLTGVDLSPYFLAIAQYRSQQRQTPARWVHAAAESTGLPDASFDLVSACLLYHELPQSAAIAILCEARRLLRPQGYLAIMDMNPRSEVYAKMPPYILTLLKSTEPYLDEYFALDLAKSIAESGFHPPTIQANSARHRTIIAQVK
jgi:ubiquinone/menaquinone biosynthesis C-methylase UbiE